MLLNSKYFSGLHPSWQLRRWCEEMPEVLGPDIPPGRGWARLRQTPYGEQVQTANGRMRFRMNSRATSPRGSSASELGSGAPVGEGSSTVTVTVVEAPMSAD